MTYTDILILGTGIAGSSLAWNLRRYGYQGQVVSIDHQEVGSTAGYGLRCTFDSVVREYGFIPLATFAGLRDITSVGPNHTVCDVDVDLYALDYSIVCNSLILNAGIDVHTDIPLSINTSDRILTCKSRTYAYRYLIDCTGFSAWCRVALRIIQAQKFYVGYVSRIPRRPTQSLHSLFKPSHITYWTDSSGYMEDLYMLNDDLLFGIWHYASRPESRPQPRETFLLRSLSSTAVAHGHSAVITAEPVLPLVMDNIAWLGDSAGQATPASSEGIRPILEASRLLAQVIASGKPLIEYQREWLRRNLTSYLLHKAFKDDLLGYNRFFQRLSRYPDVYRQLALNQTVFPPLCVVIPSLVHFAATLIRFIRLWGRYRRMLAAYPVS